MSTEGWRRFSNASALKLRALNQLFSTTASSTRWGTTCSTPSLRIWLHDPRTCYWADELEWIAGDERIIRFGLNAEFVDNSGLLWIDGLETSSREDLANPPHKATTSLNCRAA